MFKKISYLLLLSAVLALTALAAVNPLFSWKVRNTTVTRPWHYTFNTGPIKAAFHGEYRFQGLEGARVRWRSAPHAVVLSVPFRLDIDVDELKDPEQSEGVLYVVLTPKTWKTGAAAREDVLVDWSTPPRSSVEIGGIRIGGYSQAVRAAAEELIHSELNKFLAESFFSRGR